MSESRNRFLFPAVLILVAIAFIRAMSRGRLSGFLLDQGLLLLVAAIVTVRLVWSDRYFRKRHSAEWMRRYYRWVFGVIGAAGIIFTATELRRLSLEAKREGGFAAFALTLLSIAVVIGTIMGMDLFFRKRRSDQWMNGFRICMALVFVALLTGLAAYLLLSKNP
jgi:hypothetical protein